MPATAANTSARAHGTLAQPAVASGASADDQRALYATMSVSFSIDVVSGLFRPDNAALTDAWATARRLVVVRDPTVGERGELLVSYLRAVRERGGLDDFLVVDVPEGVGTGARRSSTWELATSGLADAAFSDTLHVCGELIEAALKAQLGRRDAFLVYGGQRTAPVVALAAASFRRYTPAIRIHRDLSSLVACLRDGTRTTVADNLLGALARRTYVIVDGDALSAGRIDPAESASLLALAAVDGGLRGELRHCGTDQYRSQGVASVIRLCRQAGLGHPVWRVADTWSALAPPRLDQNSASAWAVLLAARLAHRLGLLPEEAPRELEACAERVYAGLPDATTADESVVDRWLAGQRSGADGTVGVVLPTGYGAAEFLVDRASLAQVLTRGGRPAARQPVRADTAAAHAPAMTITAQSRHDLPAGFPVQFTDGILKPGDSPLGGLLPPGCRVLAIVDPYRRSQVDKVRTLLETYRRSGQVSDSAVLTIPAGERTKTVAEVDRVLRAAERLRLGGEDRIVAFGGGAVMDIAGYAAYLYLRDTPYIRVPTTLVGMIDAGIGLKVGVNVDEHKNLIGAYHPPLACLCDPAFLRTLPLAELRCGLSEAIKIGTVCDAELFTLIERYHSDLLAARQTTRSREILDRSISAMLRQLSANPFEEDLRRLPDFGHEFGHMLESLSSFRLRHGEAVAVGMALSCSLAARTGHLASGDLDRLLSLLRQVDLPIYDPVCEPDVLWRRLRDEVLPHKAGQLHLVVPSRIGVGDFIDSFDQIDAGMLQDACADLRARTQGGQP